MVSFVRGQDSKHSLGVGLLHGVKWITFITAGTHRNDQRTVKGWSLLAQVHDSIEVFMLNGKLDKKAIYEKMKTVHNIYKRKNKFDGIDVKVIFGVDKIQDMSIKKSNEILMML